MMELLLYALTAGVSWCIGVLSALVILVIAGKE